MKCATLLLILLIQYALAIKTVDQIFASAVQHQEERTTTTTKRVRPPMETKVWAKSAAFRRELNYYIRVGLAGGIAGATGTICLYPVDSAKTLRQSDPSKYSSVWKAFQELVYDRVKQTYRIGRAYRGLIPATLGAIPSSALYFGAYESMKSIIQETFPTDRTKVGQRLGVHALSAASGNILSSLVFVPKEVIKQQMQYDGLGVAQVCKNIIATKGLRGYYAGYQATLLRNIPSAMLRFVVYEELKWMWYSRQQAETKGKIETAFSWKLFAAGAIAGAIASGFMTPVDVLKTRLSTGMCPIDVPSCAQHILQTDGITGLYAGAGSRMFWSGAFSAIGFCSLETAKGLLGVSEKVDSTKPSSSDSETQEVYTHPMRMLGNALLDCRYRWNRNQKCA